MMILDNIATPVVADTGTSEKCAVGNTASSSEKSDRKSASPDTVRVSAVGTVNQNTFVVNLKPSQTNGGPNPQRKTNLLEIFGDGKGKNVPVVKALGRIVINRTLLKNPRPKPVRRATTLSRPKPGGAVARPAGPIVLRGLHDKENGLSKKDDDISGNLASFMNFKLTGLVPSPTKTSYAGVNNTFRVRLTTPDIKLSRDNNNNNTKSSFTKLSVISSPKTSAAAAAKEKVADDNDDCDLTNLSWLTGDNKNLLKTIRKCNPDDAGISLSGDESDAEDEGKKANAIFTAKSKVESGSQGGFSTRQYGQTSYDPNGKPPYSFSCLIFMAVEDSPRKMLPVKEIYSWVCKHFPYFVTARSGWKNSIRHNLSLNKCFKKVEQVKINDPGKGSLWCIDPAYRPNLIQALKRTPFYPYLYSNGIGQPLSLHNLANLLPGVRAGRVPLWSPSMSQPSESACADPDVASAAMNLIELMKGNDAIDRNSADSVQSTLKELAAEIFGRNQDDVPGSIPLVITDPADDHTYSTVHPAEATGARCPTPESEKSAPDAAYEFETCGTDLDTDDNGSAESADEENEFDLADSGFHGMAKRNDGVSGKRKRRAKRSYSPEQGKAKKAKKSSKNTSKSTQTPTKRGLKVRFQKRVKPAAGKKPRARKITPSELTSDADSGKDSPKVARKTRRRAPAKKVPAPPKVAKKAAAPPPRPSPYGTRSTARKTRQSARERRGSVLQRAAARKKHSMSADSDDEEIKLAAGSLLHLAGFRASG